MDDHEATSRLVRDAAPSTPVVSTMPLPGNGRPAPPTERLPHLFYVDPIEGTDAWGQPIMPHFYVDISTKFEIKQRMLACHDSQRAWLRAQHGVDEYLESQKRWSVARGAEVGVAFAEAFRQHRGHPYPHVNVLAELLPQHVKTR